MKRKGNHLIKPTRIASEFRRLNKKIKEPGIIRIKLPNDYSVKAPEFINHPKHYNEHPSGVECITIVEYMNFNLGNAVKYIWRTGEKGDIIQDLEKAKWYVEREIMRLRK